MAKYLVRGCYNPEGVRGLIRGGGGSARQAAIQEMIEQAAGGLKVAPPIAGEDNFFALQAMLANVAEKLSGRLEAFYYAFGDTDVFAIVDLPDHVTMTSVMLAVNAAGVIRATATVLVTPEEMDQAVKKRVSYRPPGR
ncbi:MAG TPA: GYD domain-containing protein [bacterium]|nr:GYD domain-containing protein [bacterium]